MGIRRRSVLLVLPGRSRSLSARKGSSHYAAAGILNGQIDPDPTNRRHRVRCIADTQSPGQSVDICCWAAQAMLDAALREPARKRHSNIRHMGR